MKRISITHIWTKETVSLEVETVTASYVALRWPLQGVYDLNLSKNVLTARSLKAQRKGKPLWIASDIDAVRKMVIDYLKELEGNRVQYMKPLDVREAVKRHADTMPSQPKKG